MRLLIDRGSEGTDGRSGASADPVPLYLRADRPPPVARPWVVMSMVTTLDGATALDGRSGPLGGPTDRELFMVVRALADVILVGAGTVRAEGYGAVTLDDRLIEARRVAGRADRLPRLAIVTSSLDLDVDSGLFSPPDAHDRPIVLTTADADPDKLAKVAAVAEIGAHGIGTVDLPAALADLRAIWNAEVVTCEGGPSLNSALSAVDSIDEICMTISPLLAGGESNRVAHSLLSFGTRFGLESLLEDDSVLFGRWVRQADPVT